MSRNEEPEAIGDLAAKAAAAAERAAARPKPEEPSIDPERERKLAALREEELGRLRLSRFEELVPARFAGASLTDLPDPRRGEIERWLAEPGGRNLILAGPVGVGKTHALWAVARELVLRGDESWILSATELLELLRPGGDEGALDRASRIGILGLDDLGAERASDWTAERLALIVDRRWLGERSILGSTNLTLGPDGELIAALGERTYSRLVGSNAVVLQLQGDDRRRKP